MEAAEEVEEVEEVEAFIPKPPVELQVGRFRLNPYYMFLLFASEYVCELSVGF